MSSDHAKATDVKQPLNTFEQKPETGKKCIFSDNDARFTNVGRRFDTDVGLVLTSRLFHCPAV